MQMPLLFGLVLALVVPPPDDARPGSAVVLSIERDWQSSSDRVTLCRVRATNHGPRPWAGRAIAFEARALIGSAVVARERGRFGLVLEPYGTLETLIGFEGRFDRFEVIPMPGGRDRAPRERRTPGGKKARRPRG
jgi:hypothetical protein